MSRHRCPHCGKIIVLVKEEIDEYDDDDDQDDDDEEVDAIGH